MSLPPREEAPGFGELGITAFTTTRQAGSFSLGGDEPAGEVFGRWWSVLESMAPIARLASAHQVHGTDIIAHESGWTGWLRAPSADGHAAFRTGTAMAVTLADCVPVFLGHPSGAAAVLHSGWRGTAARIAACGVALFEREGFAARDLVAHLGPAICGRCYEVGPDVFARLIGRSVDRATPVDLRALIAAQLREAGVERIGVSDSCTRCDNGRFFSHRAGDSGRQIGVIVSNASQGTH